MSEYIYTSRGTPLQDISGEICLPRERIVRCRDCRFSLAHGNGCGRNQDIYDAEPDGFCAWAERKEGGDD